ncbi:MAG: hypothetical protein DRN30_00775 [Thermoplasmata archaeon]|nr:MAG: hypothetical protein DRN30_00775 [Thermoplasmata archaeon]
MKKYRKVTIKWRDANAYSGWWEIDDIVPLDVVSTGFIVKENKNYIVLAGSVAENGQINNAISIPKKWIIK